MALSEFQSSILRLLAKNRRTAAGSYVAELCWFWREEVCRAREDVLDFPRDKAGTCVLNKDGEPFRGTVEELSVAVNTGDVIFHEGRICGAWPKII